MQLKEEQILRLKKFFTDKPVLKAYLFGSYSREEADEESDIDLLVELDYSKHIGLGFARMKLDLEKLLNKKIDIISAGGVSSYIRPFIDKDKKLIYEK